MGLSFTNRTDLETALNKGISFTLEIKAPDKFLDFSVKPDWTAALWVP